MKNIGSTRINTSCVAHSNQDTSAVTGCMRLSSMLALVFFFSACTLTPTTNSSSAISPTASESNNSSASATASTTNNQFSNTYKQFGMAPPSLTIPLPLVTTVSTVHSKPLANKINAANDLKTTNKSVPPITSSVVTEVFALAQSQPITSMPIDSSFTDIKLTESVVSDMVISEKVVIIDPAPSSQTPSDVDTTNSQTSSNVIGKLSSNSATNLPAISNNLTEDATSSITESTMATTVFPKAEAATAVAPAITPSTETINTATSPPTIPTPFSVEPNTNLLQPVASASNNITSDEPQPISSVAVTTKQKTTPAATKNSTIRLETSREELAAVDVLNEICPAVLDPKALPRFKEGMRKLFANMLPKSANPMGLMAALRSEPEYQRILAQARQDSVQFTLDDNRELCIDMVLYPSNSN